MVCMYVSPSVNATKLVVKTLLYSTSGQKLHRIPLKIQHLSLVHVLCMFISFFKHLLI